MLSCCIQLIIKPHIYYTFNEVSSEEELGITSRCLDDYINIKDVMTVSKEPLKLFGLILYI